MSRFVTDAQKLSQHLYQMDPMGTCCVENECRGEYDAVAASIIAGLHAGQAGGAAITDGFLDWFGIQLDTAVIEKIDALLDNLLLVHVNSPIQNGRW